MYCGCSGHDSTHINLPFCSVTNAEILRLCVFLFVVLETVEGGGFGKVCGGRGTSKSKICWVDVYLENLCLSNRAEGGRSYGV